MHMSLSRGKDSLVRASRTLDLPLDWSPIMTILGTLNLWGKPWFWMRLMVSVTCWYSDSASNRAEVGRTGVSCMIGEKDWVKEVGCVRGVDWWIGCCTVEWTC